MGDLSVTFDPSDLSSTVAADSATWDKGSHASSVAHAASSRIAESSAGWDSGSAAGTKAAHASSRIAESSASWDAGQAAASKASDASSAIVASSAKWEKGQPASSKIAASSANWNKASDASSKASEAVSKIGARSAIWDKKTVILKALPDDSTVADGDGITFVVPNELSGMDLVSCGAHVYTAPTSGVMKLYISNITDTVQMLTSCMTIDINEKDTTTATSQAVINTGEDDVSTADELKVYASEAGSGASGLEFRLVFKKP